MKWWESDRLIGMTLVDVNRHDGIATFRKGEMGWSVDVDLWNDEIIEREVP